MGIYDREYVRRERSGFFSPLAGAGQVCKWLILINVVCFVLQLVGSAPSEGANSFSRFFWLDPEAVLHGEIWRLLSYAFLHDPSSWTHIVFNMLFLWWFGKEVEDLYGSREFLAFYLVSAALGGAAFVIWSLAQGHPAVCIGASGAVTAVMVVFAMHFPSRRIYLWLLFPIPIWAFVAFQVAQDTILFVGGSNGATAVVVHLAGAAFGFPYQRKQWRLLALWPRLPESSQRSRPRLKIYTEERKARRPLSSAPGEEVDEHMEARVDAILEKVARNGQESLSEYERQLLLRASEVYKRRRT